MTGHHATAAEVVERLGLEPHPEGGFFRETHRSPETVETARGTRAVSTVILFLLTEVSPSRFHRLHSDETWLYQAGEPLEMIVLEPGGSGRRVSLGPVTASSLWSGLAGDDQPGGASGVAGERVDGGEGGDARPVARVPALAWQAARLAAVADGERPVSRGGRSVRTVGGERWSLVSCVVVPGFEYADFEFGSREALLGEFPAWHDDVVALT